jgi:tRNA pseudouridine55 synthase
VKHLALPDVDLEITCGSGTYIRSIARDVGHDLGCGAHLLELRRTAIGPFAAERACSLDDLNRPERVAAMRVESAEALAHLPSVGVSAEVAADLRHGRAVAADGALGSGPVVVTHAGRVVAMGEVVEDVIHPRKVFEA